MNKLQYYIELEKCHDILQNMVFFCFKGVILHISSLENIWLGYFYLNLNSLILK